MNRYGYYFSSYVDILLPSPNTVTLALDAERDILEQQLCCVKQVLSPIRTFPVELIIEEFTHLCDQTSLPSTGAQTLRLAQVCRKWRCIALSTPSLWTAISGASRDTPSPMPQFHLKTNIYSASCFEGICTVLQVIHYADMTRVHMTHDTCLPYDLKNPVLGTPNRYSQLPSKTNSS